MSLDLERKTKNAHALETHVMKHEKKYQVLECSAVNENKADLKFAAFSYGRDKGLVAPAEYG